MRHLHWTLLCGLILSGCAESAAPDDSRSPPHRYPQPTAILKTECLDDVYWLAVDASVLFQPCLQDSSVKLLRAATEPDWTADGKSVPSERVERVLSGRSLGPRPAYFNNALYVAMTGADGGSTTIVELGAESVSEVARIDGIAPTDISTSSEGLFVTAFHERTVGLFYVKPQDGTTALVARGGTMTGRAAVAPLPSGRVLWARHNLSIEASAWEFLDCSASGDCTPIASVPWDSDRDITEMDVAGDYAYAVISSRPYQSNRPTINQLFRLNLRTGSGEIVANLKGLVSLTATQQGVIWVEEFDGPTDPHSGGIYYMANSSRVVDPVLTKLTWPSAVAVTGDSLYWVEREPMSVRFTAMRMDLPDRLVLGSSTRR